MDPVPPSHRLTGQPDPARRATPDSSGEEQRPQQQEEWQGPVLPPDPALPHLSRLFDPDWIAALYRRLFPDATAPPTRVRPQRLTYRPGRRALVGYVAEHREGDWVLEEEFAAEALAGRAEIRAFRYPRDPYLPGLAAAASPVEAQSLLGRHVALHPTWTRIELVRYRPSTRAVLRYRVGWRQRRIKRVSLFVRVMRPQLIDRFIKAGQLVSRSAFAVPALAGCWAEGGVVWLARLPGRNVRELIRTGQGPDPELALDALASLWALPPPETATKLSVPRTLRWTADFLRHLLQGREGTQELRALLAQLEPFAAGWTPVGVAHNDFYDDQLILLPSGRLALADFEECGVGDPMLDVGNWLAHLRWSSFFGRSEAAAAYGEELRAIALRRFGWAERELRLREAYALLLLCTNPVRSLRPDWAELTEAGLRLARAPLLDLPLQQRAV